MNEGDKVGSFEVLDTPGHSRGHIALWRAEDKTLVLADVLFNLNPLTMKTGLREPPLALTLDPAQNRDSARKVAELEPEFGAVRPRTGPQELRSVHLVRSNFAPVELLAAESPRPQRKSFEL